MRKSDHSKVLRRGVAGGIAGMIILLLLFGAFAPAAMANGWPDCNWIQNTSCDGKFSDKLCVSQDAKIIKAWLGNCTTGAELGPCTPGPSVEACVWIEFGGKAGRYQVYSFFDLYIGDQDQGRFCDCNDSLPQAGVPYNIYGPRQWTCGQKVELKNVLVAWTVRKDCNCSVPACCNNSCLCQHGHQKCWWGGDITVEAPLVANFTHTAPQCYCTDIIFNGTATGGSPSYTFSWDFGDGKSTTGQNTSHHYGSYGIYAVNLTVTDSGSPKNTSRAQSNFLVI